MAGRPPKKGIDYAGWSVDIFDNDTKIDKLLEARGWEGFGIYFYLCLRAYGGEGYFYRWSYGDSASTSRKMGCGISAGTVRETVGYCLHIGLFDKGLFDRQGILTSKGIQRRYWEVVKARDVRTVISDYWLLQDDECKGLLKTPLNTNYPAGNTNYPAGNTNYPAGNTNYPPIKESKVKESKEKTERVRTMEPRRIEDFIHAYPKKCNRHLTEIEYVDLLTAEKVTEDDLVQCAVNYADACKARETPERYIKNAENFLKDMVFDDYMPGKYKKPKSEKQKNTFMNFEQRDTDYDGMVLDMLKKRLNGG